MDSVMETLTISELAPAARRAAWQDAYSAVHLADRVWFPPQHSPEEFAGRMSWRRLDDLLVVDFACDPFAGRFSPGSLSNDFVGIQVSHAERRERVALRDQRTLTVSGTFSIWETAQVREFEFLNGGGHLVVLIPRDALQQAAVGSFKLTELIIDQDTPPIRLLKGLLLSIQQETGPLSAVTAAAARNGILELLVSASRPAIVSSNAAVSDSMRAAIGQWIDKRLQSGELSPSEAAAAHGISVRSLHRLFASTGDSFGDIARSRRVAKARRDLVAGGDSIQAIANRWGYADASHFCREFKRTFEMTPTEYRQRDLSTPQDGTNAR
jgi:AraC family transcriptional activator of tynA and feaB